ncbi:hypothetical protein M0L20_16875 [Spirosoma sp. RP8]|uniref:DUF551 domain-containing protein n=1 Tax=Spirosoma liriopis TaxID=2937440 RepID=A0ABT0HN32_9BACT|nr:hypothetical protein [Spirosoma liriopis]MCK8493542.1 hypothetical protein [Spirosoma liriopis]
MATLPGTDIELGKWYPATQPPPDLYVEPLINKYAMILNIVGFGPLPGFYMHQDGKFYWHCERYDDFDDERMPGWSRSQEINNNLDWVTDEAKSVNAWMLIPDAPEDFPSVQDDAVNSYVGTLPTDGDNDKYDIDEDEDDIDDGFITGPAGGRPLHPINPSLN